MLPAPPPRPRLAGPWTGAGVLRLDSWAVPGGQIAAQQPPARRHAASVVPVNDRLRARTGSRMQLLPHTLPYHGPHSPAAISSRGPQCRRAASPL